MVYHALAHRKRILLRPLTSADSGIHRLLSVQWSVEGHFGPLRLNSGLFGQCTWLRLNQASTFVQRDSAPHTWRLRSVSEPELERSRESGKSVGKFVLQPVALNSYEAKMRIQFKTPIVVLLLRDSLWYNEWWSGTSMDIPAGLWISVRISLMTGYFFPQWIIRAIFTPKYCSEKIYQRYKKQINR